MFDSCNLEINFFFNQSSFINTSSYFQRWALATIFATTRQCREAEKLSLVALSLIIRKLSRCRCREEKLSLIFATLDSQIDSHHVLYGGWCVVVVGCGWRVGGLGGG